MSPLLGPFSFSSSGKPMVMLPAVLVALRPEDPARRDVAALPFGGLMPDPPAMGDNGELFASALIAFDNNDTD